MPAAPVTPAPIRLVVGYDGTALRGVVPRPNPGALVGRGERFVPFHWVAQMAGAKALPRGLGERERRRRWRRHAGRGREAGVEQFLIFLYG